MWSAWSDAWHLYWSTGGVWLRQSRPMDAGWHLAGEGSPLALEQALAEVGQSRRRWPRPQVSVWLSGALARPFVLDPVAGLKGWEEARSLARARAQSALGFRADCHVVLESWPGREAVRGVAMERDTLDALQGHARGQRVRLSSIRPAWSLALQQHCEAGHGADSLAVLEADAATLLGDDSDGRPRATSQLALGQGLELGRLLLAAGPLQGVRRTASLDLQSASASEHRHGPGLWSYEP